MKERWGEDGIGNRLNIQETEEKSNEIEVKHFPNATLDFYMPEILLVSSRIGRFVNHHLTIQAQIALFVFVAALAFRRFRGVRSLFPPSHIHILPTHLQESIMK